MIERTRNLFVIGRSRLGPEDRLTEMFAFLLERRPDLIARWLNGLATIDVPEGEWLLATQVSVGRAGRFDMTLELPGSAFVVVESKLEAELTDEQLGRYLDHVAGRDEPLRALVTITKHPPPRSQALLERAHNAGVALVATRWQELGALIAEPGEADLAGDFVEMLIEEGLVVPQALGTEDWHVWNRGAAVLARLKLLLREARPGMQDLSPGLQASSRWGADERWIYNGFTSQRLEIGLGFSANESPRRPESPPIIWAYLRDPAIPREEVAARTAAAIRQVLNATAVWSGVPTVSRPASDVLTASDFREQVEQAVHFAFTVARSFQEVGYLPGDLPLIEPSLPPGALQAPS